MSRVKDLYTASYIGVVLSVLFYPNYSILLCFVKINISSNQIIEIPHNYYFNAPKKKPGTVCFSRPSGVHIYKRSTVCSVHFLSTIKYDTLY